MKITRTDYFINTDTETVDKTAGCLPDDLNSGQGKDQSSELSTGTGLRIALLADFHNGDADRALAIVREDVPDVIMIPGDVVIGYYPEDNKRIIDRCPNIKPFLEGCAGLAPTYMSLGNHECLLCDEELDELRTTGITILDNDWTVLSVKRRQGDSAQAAAAGTEESGNMSGATDRAEEPVCHDDYEQNAPTRILVGGLTSGFAMNYRSFRDRVNSTRSENEYIRYPERRRPRDIGKYPTDSSWLEDFAGEDGYKILLCHHPEYWSLRDPMLRDKRIDLVLSGHAHGGQWRILGRGIYAPGQGVLPKYTSGVHYGPYGSLIVSRGLDNPYRKLPRWGNPCEVVYIEIYG